VTRNPWPVRIALYLALALLVAYSLFGIAAPLYWGHDGYNAAVYLLRARTSLRNHILVPCNWTGFDPPRPDALYLHHPIGYHHILTLLIPIFGDHEWLARAVGLAGSLLVCGVLYSTVKRFWSREAGALVVWIWVLLPMITSFSAFCDPMMPTFACTVWGVGAYLRLLDNRDPKQTRKLLLHAFLAYAICGVLMWEMYFIAPMIAVHAFFIRRRHRDLPPLRVGSLDVSALLAHVIVIGAACVLMMGFHLWFTHHTGAWGDFTESYRVRKAPPGGQYVIDRHLQWLEILYGAPPILLALAWITLFLARTLVGRSRLRDLLPLTFLYVNSLYIWMFAEGSAVHLYRVFMYSGFLALAIMDLVVEVHAGARRLGLRGAVALIPPALLLAGYFHEELPHSWHNLVESRVMMGTHSQPGYNPEREKLRFAQEVHALTAGRRLIVHYRHLSARKEFWYYLDRSFDEINSMTELPKLPARAKDAVLLIDEQLLDVSERPIFRDLIAHHPVTFFDHYAMIDLRSTTPGEKSWAFADRPTTPAYRFFVSFKYAPLALVRKPYLPGLCEAAQAGAPLATDEPLPDPPKNPALLPCWHNALIARGATGEADNVETLVVGRTARADLPLGSAKVIAAAREGNLIRVVYRAGGPEKAELRYVAERPKAKQPIVSSRSWTLTPPAEWRKGFVYVDTVPLQPGATSFAVELFTPPAKPGEQPTVVSHAELPH
jgi:4-amino-4-deoxy-L-arabinose transferase-like glycosyltransferase